MSDYLTLVAVQGYLKSIEKSLKFIIPKEVKDVIIIFIKTYKVYGIGQNKFGQIGNGKTNTSGEWVPFKVECKDEIFDISVGSKHNLCLTKTHKIISFGKNKEHQCTSKINESYISSPFTISKKDELGGINENIFVDRIIAMDDQSIIILNQNKQC